jgi:hypothetical protein
MDSPKSKDDKATVAGIRRIPVGKILAKSPFLINTNVELASAPRFEQFAADGSLLKAEMKYKEGITIHLVISTEGVISIDFGEQPFYINTGGYYRLEQVR